MTSQIKASDLISVSDERAEAMLQKAGQLHAPQADPAAAESDRRLLLRGF